MKTVFLSTKSLIFVLFNEKPLVNLKIYEMNLILKLFACIIVLSFISCGGEEGTGDPDPMNPDPVMTNPIPDATASVTIDGSARVINSISGKIIDSNVGGWGIRDLEISLVTGDMGIIDLGVQNVTLQTPGICVREELYKFMPDNSDCKEINGDDYCNSTSVKYSQSDGTRYTSNLNVGTLEILSCDADSSVISGVFSGTINKVGFNERIEISGEFENVDIEK